MQGLAQHVNVSTATFVKNESRLLVEELAKRFSPRMPKSQRGIAYDRRSAFRIGRVGLNQIPWSRLQRVIQREHPRDRKPIVIAAVAKPSERRAIKALGTLAAGFIGRDNRLGAKAKPFVIAHVSQSHGDVHIHNGPLTKWVRLTNFTPWLGNIRGRVWLVKKSINSRTAAMRMNMKLMQSGVKKYWTGTK